MLVVGGSGLLLFSFLRIVCGISWCCGWVCGLCRLILV